LVEKKLRSPDFVALLCAEAPSNLEWHNQCLALVLWAAHNKHLSLMHNL